MDAFLGRLTAHQYNEHKAFWILNGPMGWKRMDWLFANLLSWYVSGKTGKSHPLKKFFLEFGKDPAVAKQEKIRTEEMRMEVYKAQHGKKARQARRDAKRAARDKRRGGKKSQ